MVGKGTETPGQRGIDEATQVCLKEVKRLIWKPRNVFLSLNSKLVGKTSLVDMEIEVPVGTHPISSASRPLHPDKQANLDLQVGEWLKQKVIQPSKSPWASPLVPVPKKDGTVRWAVDYRRLNAVKLADRYPIPNLTSLLEKAGGHKIYSTLDAASAYFAIPMAESSRTKTAFCCPLGLFELLRMPFGLANAPSVYSRFVALALSHLGSQDINIYLDDVLLFSDNSEEHLARLDKVLEAHAQAGILVKPSKTFLFQSKVQYLGHELSIEDISMIDEYIQKIVDWPMPTTRKGTGQLSGILIILP